MPSNMTMNMQNMTIQNMNVFVSQVNGNQDFFDIVYQDTNGELIYFRPFQMGSNTVIVGGNQGSIPYWVSPVNTGSTFIISSNYDANSNPFRGHIYVGSDGSVTISQNTSSQFYLDSATTSFGDPAHLIVTGNRYLNVTAELNYYISSTTDRSQASAFTIEQ